MPPWRAGGGGAPQRRDGARPLDGLARLIVDLVQTGSTLKANGLRESEVIAHVTSRLIVNRTALKTRPEAIGAWIARFRAALAERDAR